MVVLSYIDSKEYVLVGAALFAGCFAISFSLFTGLRSYGSHSGIFCGLGGVCREYDFSEEFVIAMRWNSRKHRNQGLLAEYRDDGMI